MKFECRNNYPLSKYSRRSERCHAKIDVEISASAVPVQTGRRKRAAKLEIFGNNEEEVKASPAKRRYENYNFLHIIFISLIKDKRNR